MTKHTVILRAVEIKDCSLIYEYENDTTAWNDGVSNRFYSMHAIEQYVLSTQNDDIFSTQQLRLMIDIDQEGKRFTVGCVDFYDMDFKNHKAGIGIYIAKSFRGNGYAKSSLWELEKYAFEVLNLHQLYAFVSQTNATSNALFSDCDFTLTATLPDWLQTSNQYHTVNVYQKKNNH